MKVKQLISALKQMPQDLNVYTAMHDNRDWETAGETCSVVHVTKADFEDGVCGTDRERFDDAPDEFVTIAG